MLGVKNANSHFIKIFKSDKYELPCQLQGFFEIFLGNKGVKCA